MWDLLRMTKSSPEARCIPESEQEWGPIGLGFYSQMCLVQEGRGFCGGRLSTSESDLHLDPPRPPPRPTPSSSPHSCSHLNLENIPFHNAVLKLVS